MKQKKYEMLLAADMSTKIYYLILDIIIYTPRILKILTLLQLKRLLKPLINFVQEDAKYGEEVQQVTTFFTKDQQASILCIIDKNFKLLFLLSYWSVIFDPPCDPYTYKDTLEQKKEVLQDWNKIKLEIQKTW